MSGFPDHSGSATAKSEDDSAELFPTGSSDLVLIPALLTVEKAPKTPIPSNALQDLEPLPPDALVGLDPAQVVPLGCQESRAFAEYQLPPATADFICPLFTPPITQVEAATSTTIVGAEATAGVTISDVWAATRIVAGFAIRLHPVGRVVMLVVSLAALAQHAETVTVGGEAQTLPGYEAVVGAALGGNRWLSASTTAPKIFSVNSFKRLVTKAVNKRLKRSPHCAALLAHVPIIEFIGPEPTVSGPTPLRDGNVVELEPGPCVPVVVHACRENEGAVPILLPVLQVLDKSIDDGQDICFVASNASRTDRPVGYSLYKTMGGEATMISSVRLDKLLSAEGPGETETDLAKTLQSVLVDAGTALVYNRVSGYIARTQRIGGLTSDVKLVYYDDDYPKRQAQYSGLYWAAGDPDPTTGQVIPDGTAPTTAIAWWSPDDPLRVIKRTTE